MVDTFSVRDIFLVQKVCFINVLKIVLKGFVLLYTILSSYGTSIINSVIKSSIANSEMQILAKYKRIYVGRDVSNYQDIPII